MEKYKVDVPEGTSGSWAIKRFEVSRSHADVFNLRAILNNERGRYVCPGAYTKLTRNGTVIMSDTPSEIEDHLGFIRHARETGGRILVHGLGLGMCVNAVLGSPKVEHVLVIEKSPDVIALVAPHYRDKFGDRLEIRQGDAYTWKPEKGAGWSCAWHDIWDDLCTSNLEEMTRLHRRFGRRVDWQDSWGKSLLQSRRSREKKEERRSGWWW